MKPIKYRELVEVEGRPPKDTKELVERVVNNALAAKSNLAVDQEFASNILKKAVKQEADFPRQPNAKVREEQQRQLGRDRRLKLYIYLSEDELKDLYKLINHSGGKYRKLDSLVNEMVVAALNGLRSL